MMDLCESEKTYPGSTNKCLEPRKLVKDPRIVNTSNMTY